MNSGRYVSKALVIPAPETPITINSGGSQQQLEAMMAERMVPTLVNSSPRPVDAFSVAPGDFGCCKDQQLGAGAPLGTDSSDIVYVPVICKHGRK